MAAILTTASHAITKVLDIAVANSTNPTLDKVGIICRYCPMDVFIRCLMEARHGVPTLTSRGIVGDGYTGALLCFSKAINAAPVSSAPTVFAAIRTARTSVGTAISTTPVASIPLFAVEYGHFASGFSEGITTALEAEGGRRLAHGPHTQPQRIKLTAGMSTRVPNIPLADAKVAAG